MGLYELSEMGYEEQLLFAKEYLPLLYKKLTELGELGEETEIVKEEGDLSPILPSFNDDDKMYFTKNGRREDKWASTLKKQTSTSQASQSEATPT
jgi:hypothetical protein